MDKEKKICLTVKAFLENSHKTIIELSELPELEGISKSSIQRYLNDPKIIELFDQKTFDHIQKLLEENNLEGKKRGGLNSFKNNKALKNYQGRFVGNFKDKDDNKVTIKKKHILAFSEIFINNPEMSLQQIADYYNESTKETKSVTRDYVYDCLNSNETYGLFSSELEKEIKEQLERRKHIGNINGANITNERRK